MRIKDVSAALLIVVACGGHALAEDMIPGHAHNLDLAGIGGVAYYTEEPDGYRVVATLAAKGGVPVRVIATLPDDRMLTFSVPGPLGGAERRLDIVRSGERLSVAAHPAPMN